MRGSERCLFGVIAIVKVVGVLCRHVSEWLDASERERECKRERERDILCCIISLWDV